jgi:hypothetical protein
VASPDADHREVIETLLAMAEAEHRWGDAAEVGRLALA